MDLPEREDPPHPMMGHNGGPPLEDDQPGKPKPKPTDKKDDDDED